MKNILQRLIQFIDYKDISYHAFDVSIDASNGYIGKQIKNNGAIGSNVLEKIHQAYSELNLNWLLTGEGNMIIKDELKNNNINIVSEPDSLYCNRCSEKDKQISVLNELVVTLKSQIIEANKNTETYRSLLIPSDKRK